MRDLDAVDRQLAELGPELEPRQVRALLDRVLGSDRSLARLNELLDAFGAGPAAANMRSSLLRDALAGPAYRASQRPPERADASGEARGTPRSDPPQSLRAPNPPGVRNSLPPRIVSPLAPVQGDSPKTATPWPPVASVTRSARDTLVDAAVPPPAIPKSDEHEFDAATAALFGITAPPPAMQAEAPAAIEPARVESEPAPVAPESTLFDPFATEPELAAEAQERPSSKRSTLQWAVRVEPPASDAPASSSIAPALRGGATFSPQDDAASTGGDAPQIRASIRALLDQELDPNEFPSSHPPRAHTLPPLQRPLPEPDPEPAPVAAQDGFEMLIDDSEEDDIMEIDDMELEEIE